MNKFRKISIGVVIAGIILFSSLSALLLVEIVFYDNPEFEQFTDHRLSKFVNPEYQYVPPLIREKQTIEIPVKIHFPNGTVRDSLFPLRTTTNLVFQTTALSAQNPITVNTKLNVDIPDGLSIILENQYYMFFPFSQDISKERDMFEQTGGFIILNKTSATEYQGTGKIMYPFEGKQPFFIIMKYEDLEKNRQGDTTFVGGFDLRYDIGGHPFLIIEPSSTTTILRTNVIIVALTFIAVAFGLDQIRKNITK